MLLLPLLLLLPLGPWCTEAAIITPLLPRQRPGRTRLSSLGPPFPWWWCCSGANSTRLPSKADNFQTAWAGYSKGRRHSWPFTDYNWFSSLFRSQDRPPKPISSTNGRRMALNGNEPGVGTVRTTGNHVSRSTVPSWNQRRAARRYAERPTTATGAATVACRPPQKRRERRGQTARRQQLSKNRGKLQIW